MTTAITMSLLNFTLNNLKKYSSYLQMTAQIPVFPTCTAGIHYLFTDSLFPEHLLFTAAGVFLSLQAIIAFITAPPAG